MEGMAVRDSLEKRPSEDSSSKLGKNCTNGFNEDVKSRYFYFYEQQPYLADTSSTICKQCQPRPLLWLKLT